MRHRQQQHRREWRRRWWRRGDGGSGSIRGRSNRGTRIQSSSSRNSDSIQQISNQRTEKSTKTVSRKRVCALIYECRFFIPLPGSISSTKYEKLSTLIFHLKLIAFSACVCVFVRECVCADLSIFDDSKRFVRFVLVECLRIRHFGAFGCHSKSHIF